MPHSEIPPEKRADSDFEVPVNADFIIEGCVYPGEPFRDEGPFGDHARYSGNLKLAIRNPNRHGKGASWGFGVRPMFGLRPSVFGFCSWRLPQSRLREHLQDLPDAGLQIRARLLGHGQMMFTKYLVVVDDECLRTATNMHNTSEVFFPPVRKHRPTTRLPAKGFARANPDG
jgi:3-polyprenyl-4-hydroxybenzoate decarboxylase